MPFNFLWGVGRDARAAGTPSITTIEVADIGLPVGAGSDTRTATIGSQVQIIAVAVSIIPLQRTQNGTNVRLRILIDENLVATYQLAPNQTATDPVVWFVNEVFPYSYGVVGSSTLKVFTEADAGGATGYDFSLRVSAIGIFI